MSEKNDSQPRGNLLKRLMQNIQYCINGVWDDTRTLWSVKTVKIINLSVRSFLDRDLQVRSCALTYNTVLAIVPALAMLFAIARGFGFQNLLQSELFRYFPAQHQALETALTYVDNYLAQASQGVFVGIGLIFLLWTLISLMSNVEDTFNHVWGTTTKRSLHRKFTDYTALFLLLPVLMVCSAGISIFMSDAVQHVFEGNPLSPVMHRLLAFMPTVISWIIFTAAYYMVPNAKVHFKGALLAGILCGTVFEMVQWLFVTGQVYVSKYNAIYGSFAFLPLLLVWLQLSWLIALSGVVLSYAWQNFDSFAYRDKTKDMSQVAVNDLSITVMALATKRFKQHQGPLKRSDLIQEYELPAPLAEQLLTRLLKAGLLIKVATNGEDDGQDPAYQPTADPDDFSLTSVLMTLTEEGSSEFVGHIGNQRLTDQLAVLTALREQRQKTATDVSLMDLPDSLPADNPIFNGQ